MFWLVWNWHVEFYIYPLLKCWHPANIDFKIVWKGYYVSKIKLFNNEAFWNNFIISCKGSNSKCVIYRRKGGGEITINLFDDCQFYHFSFVFYILRFSKHGCDWMNFLFLNNRHMYNHKPKQKPFPDSWGLFIFVLICKLCLHVTKPDMRQS